MEIQLDDLSIVNNGCDLIITVAKYDHDRRYFIESTLDEVRSCVPFAEYRFYTVGVSEDGMYLALVNKDTGLRINYWRNESTWCLNHIKQRHEFN